jgi:hypothetical protein
MAYDFPRRALARSARASAWTARPAATRDLRPAARWTWLLEAERRDESDDGNFWQGIVIGCLLSLPIWTALVLFVRLLLG